jgi:hypothetical protein
MGAKRSEFSDPNGGALQFTDCQEFRDWFADCSGGPWTSTKKATSLTIEYLYC